MIRHYCIFAVLFACDSRFALSNDNGESIHLAAYENNLAMTNYDVIIEHWSNSTPNDKSDKTAFPSVDRTRKTRLVIDRVLKKCYYATRTTTIEELGPKRSSTSSSDLRFYEDGVLIRPFQATSWLPTATKRMDFYSFLSENHVPLVEHSTMAYFPYIVRTGSKDFENEIRNNATGARNATSKILPDGTTFMTTVGDRNGVKHTRSLVFDVNCFVPRRLSTETKKGEEIQSSYSHSVEYESAKGLFRPIMFSLDRSEVVSRIDPNTKQLKRIKMDVVATVTVEWLQFVEAELQFPDRKKCTATFPDVLPLLEISTPTKISSQQRTK